jgi:DNA-binding NarL/FixJ family response regulator
MVMNTEFRKRDIALVVDDSPETLRMLTDALDSAGMTVMVALDGAAAMRIVEQITPDIVLLDAMMPGIDGFETPPAEAGSRPRRRAGDLHDGPRRNRAHRARPGSRRRRLRHQAAEMIARIKVHLANARLSQSARAALDVSGRYLFAVNRVGKVIWATPQAQKLLDADDRADTGAPLELPQPWLEWLEELHDGLTQPKAALKSSPLRTADLRMQYMGKLGPDEFLQRLSRDTGTESSWDLSKELGLTTRESEVLSWLSKGKTNRDIAQILGLSPRTVDKHLEQIYEKLGVENRTAAVATGSSSRDN